MRAKTDRGVYSTRMGMGWLHPSAEGPQKGQGAGNEGHSGFRISSRCISVFRLVHPYQCGPADHHQWGQCDQYYHVKKKYYLVVMVIRKDSDSVSSRDK